MKIQHISRLLATGTLVCGFTGMTDHSVSAQGVELKHHEMAVVAVGCLQREKEFRHSVDRHSTGLGSGDEYILTNAVIGTESMAVQPVTEQESNCVSSPDGQAFELTGPGEDGLRHAPESLVGHRVVINGRLKHAKHDIEVVGTSGTTGEFTPLSTNGGWMPGDLKLREINVDAFSLAPVAIPEPIAEAPAPAPAPTPEYTPAPAPAPAPEPQAAPAPALPKTASPFPLIGLLGLLSLVGGFGLRAFEHRRASL